MFVGGGGGGWGKGAGGREYNNNCLRRDLEQS